MVQTKVRSIDGDGHVIENIPQLVEHLEAPYRGWYGTGRGGAVALTPGDGAPRCHIITTHQTFPSSWNTWRLHTVAGTVQVGAAPWP